MIFLSFIVPTSVIKHQRKKSFNETHEDSVSRTVIEKTIMLAKKLRGKTISENEIALSRKQLLNFSFLKN